MSRRTWVLAWACLGLANTLFAAVLMSIAIVDDNWGRALFDLVCALVSGCWGGWFLAEWRDAR